MYGRVSFDKENVFINGEKVVGITEFSANMGYSRTPIVAIGMGYVGQAIEGEMPKAFSFTKYIGDSEEDLIGLLDQEVTGALKYQSNQNSYSQEWSATRARISSYELNCAVGDLPSASYSFEIIGRAGFTGQHLSNEQSLEVGDFTVIRPGDLVFSGDNHFITNRLQSFKYSVEIPYKKTHLVGSNFEAYFSQNDPIQISLEMEFELDGLDNEELLSIPFCEKGFNGTFLFNKCGEEIRRFSILNAELIDSRINGTIGSNATFGVTYRYFVDNVSRVIVDNRINPSSSSSSSRSSSSVSSSSSMSWPTEICVRGAGSNNVNGSYIWNDAELIYELGDGRVYKAADRWYVEYDGVELYESDSDSFTPEGSYRSIGGTEPSPLVLLGICSSSSSRSSSSSSKSSSSGSSSSSSSSKSSSSISSSSSSAGAFTFLYEVNFEGAGETKASYSYGSVTLNSIPWSMSNALIGTSTLDKKYQNRSMRMKFDSILGDGISEMEEDIPEGFTKISFYAARFGGDAEGGVLNIEYSIDEGASWSNFASLIINSSSLSYFEKTGSVAQSARIRFIYSNPLNISERRINIDNIRIERE